MRTGTSGPVSVPPSAPTGASASAPKSLDTASRLPQNQAAAAAKPAAAMAPPGKTAAAGKPPSSKSFIENLASFAKFVAKVFVGVPFAVVGTAIGTIVLTYIEAAAALNAKAVKSFFGTTIIDDPVLESYKQSVKDWMEGLWMDYALDPYIKTTEAIMEKY